ARLLQARVIGVQDQEYRGTDDYPARSPGPPPAAPRHLLDNVGWSFPEDVPADAAGFEAAVWQQQYLSGNDHRWDPEEVVLGSPRVRFNYLCWRGDDQVEPTVELVSDNHEWFRAGELLFKIHRAVAPDLQRGDHRFLEGLTLYFPPPPPGQPPFYS